MSKAILKAQGGLPNEPPIVKEFMAAVWPQVEGGASIFDRITLPPDADERMTQQISQNENFFRFMAASLQFIHDRFGVSAGIFYNGSPSGHSPLLHNLLEHTEGRLRVPDRH